jgi:hypothetical protein
MDKSVHVHVNEILKNNDVLLYALTILPEDCNITPSIYLESFYEDYCKGKSLDEIVDSILQVYESTKTSSALDINQFQDYSIASQYITYKLINFESNQRLLQDVPYIRFLDLAIVFHLLLDTEITGEATALIHHAHLKLWNIDVHTLYQIAIQNTPKLLGEEFFQMHQLMEHLLLENFNLTAQPLSNFNLLDEDFNDLPQDISRNPENMYVLTNSKRHNGAAVILNQNLLTKISNILDTDFYILPSSIHEVIVLPCIGNMSANELSEIVQEINVSDVEKTEVLSNHVYKFIKSTHELTY